MTSVKKTTTFASLLVVVLILPLSSTAQDWQLVWSDEFEGDSLKMANWEYMIGTGTLYGIPGWGNNELQYYTDRPENIFVEDGKLHIVALEENFGQRNYTSARIRSIDRADFLYGRFEVRAKLPEGQGLWPAIWMLPTESVYGGWPRSGEIDIMELVGHEPDIVHGTVHYGDPWPNNRERGGQYRLRDGKFSDDFHVFTIDWEPERITWYVDDRLYYFVTPGNLSPFNWPFDQKFHILLNVAVGGNWPGSPDHTTEFPQKMIIDYVRVYQDAELTSSDQDFRDVPETFTLHQNHPNPFNPATNISFDLPEAAHVTLSVYDLMGRQVSVPAEGEFQAGSHTVSFDAVNLSSGTYIYRLNAGSWQQSRTMQLIK